LNKFFLLVFFFSLQVNAQVLKKYRFDEVEQLVEREARPIVVFFYTDWCRYCKMMEQTTFKDKEIISVLNQKFYFIAMNAEDKKEVQHFQKTFRAVPTANGNGTHEIVEYYLRGSQKAYPSILVLNPKFERKILLQTYMNSTDFKRFLTE